MSVAASASAQLGPPPPPPGAGPAGRQWDLSEMRARFEERRQQRQQVLHDALGLRPDQDGAWEAFLATEHRPDGERGPGMRHREGEDGQRGELSTPQRLDRMAQRMSERQARFAQRADAIKRFYATLDPRQQKTFDALAMEEHGHGMGGFGGHGHGHMGPGGPGGPPPGSDGERG